jgi:hypothetical protein
MAYVINPDGTITTVEADYDRNGNLKPKINCELLKEQVVNYNPNIAPEGRKVKPKQSVPIKKKKKVSRSIPLKRQLRFVSTAEIELFFKDRIANKQRIYTDEYLSIVKSLPKVLKDYFISRYHKYIGYNSVVDDYLRSRKNFKKPKNKKKIKKNKNPHVVKNVTMSSSTSSGFSIGDIATYSSLHKRTPDGDLVNGQSLKGASRQPKFGYARDRFGRVQERDSFNEDLRNEFRNAQRHQKNYDYSSYDADDDHDGAYSGFE